MLTHGLHNCGRSHSCCFKPLVCGNLLQWPQKPNIRSAGKYVRVGLCAAFLSSSAAQETVCPPSWLARLHNPVLWTGSGTQPSKIKEECGWWLVVFLSDLGTQKQELGETSLHI
jgi:hypothetical protein